MSGERIETERLLLRPWREADLEPFIRMNEDPEVVEYLPSPISGKESQQFVRRSQAHFAEQVHFNCAVLLFATRTLRVAGQA